MNTGKCVSSAFYRISVSLALMFLVSFNSGAAPLSFVSVTRSLPDGTSIGLFVSGDEFFNYLHDRNGFPVGQGSDGYFYYMTQSGDDFVLTAWKVYSADPKLIAALKPVRTPSWVLSRRQEREREIQRESSKKGIIQGTKSSGTVNNLVIYLKFKDEPDFSVPRSQYEQKLNSLSSVSMRNYFREVSYGKLDIVSYHMPGGATENVSYTDQHPRNYYRPFNASSNPSGYQTYSDRVMREQEMLANAVEWVDSNYPLPSGVNFDADLNGKVDNVCFIVKGSPDGWNELLWPHRWILFYSQASIGGLSVWDFTLQLEAVNVTTLSHEMFHSLGAPDLYHYNNSSAPVGPWDLMASGGGHPGAWMKYRYGAWISSIPEIIKSGTYSIRPLSGETMNSYIIRSPYRPDQLFILEFRKAEGLYEGSLPASGLIITRVDSRYTGNSGGPPDEIYVFRLGGSPSDEGNISSAAFSDLMNRSSFSDFTDPYGFLQDGNKAGISLEDITWKGDSILFTVEMDKPVGIEIKPELDTAIKLSWKYQWNSDFLVAVSPTPDTLPVQQGITYDQGDSIGGRGFILYKGPLKTFTHRGLESDEQYYYTILNLKNNDPPEYSEPVITGARTGIITIPKLPYFQDFDGTSSSLPRGWKFSDGKQDLHLEKDFPFSSPNSIIIRSEESGNEWFYTPGFSLSGLQKYMITFRYRCEDPYKKGSLYLKSGITRQIIEKAGSPLMSVTDFQHNDFVIQKVIFKPFTTGTAYFAFRSGTGGGGVVIDDFQLEPVPPATTDHTMPSEFYPNPTSGRLTVPASETTEIMVFRSDGVKVFGTVIESMQEIDLSRLGTGLFIIKFRTQSGSSSHRLVILR